MKTKQILLSAIVTTTFLITGCGGSAVPTETMMPNDATATEVMLAHATSTPDAMMEQETPTPDTVMAHETPTADTMMHETPTVEAMMESPNWYAASYSDARTGKSFSIEAFKGKVILVETMAVWCPTCKKQQSEIKALQDALGGNPELVSISLDIDPNEDASILGNYVSQTGFDWFYAVAPANVSQEIASLYGDQYLNPPSTPILIIDRHGEAHPLPFGLKSSEDLMKAIQPYLDGSM